MDGTKRCTRCSETKALTDFNRWSRSDDGRQPHCRACSKAYYQANRDRHMRNVKRNQRRYRVDVQLRVIEYLREHPCVDCGETDIVVLEFDHVRGDKRFCISEMMGWSYPWSSVLAEIEKCDVRCANCHRRRTAEEYGYFTTRVDQIRERHPAFSEQLRLDL